jgi:predicted MFS family arabinose efflux permease
MAAGLVAIACAFVFLGVAESGVLYLIAALLLGSGSGISFTMGNTILMSSASPENRGLSSAIIFASMDIGIGTGSMLGGLVAVRLGYGGMFLAASFTGIAALAALYLRSRRQGK